MLFFELLLEGHGAPTEMKTRVGSKLQATVVSKGDSKTRLNAASILHSDMKSFEMAAIKVLLQLHCWRRRRTLGLLLSALLSMSIAGVHVAGPVPSATGLHVRDDRIWHCMEQGGSRTWITCIFARSCECAATGGDPFLNNGMACSRSRAGIRASFPIPEFQGKQRPHRTGYLVS